MIAEGGTVSKISGARYMAETLKGYGVTHVFYKVMALAWGRCQDVADRIGG
jgi:hypothetical protein